MKARILVCVTAIVLTMVAWMTPANARPVASRLAKLVALYDTAVPAWERAALRGHYVITYADPHLACGTGCTALVSPGHVESSFSAALFSSSSRTQRDGIVHEAAHAYGFLYLQQYAAPSWAATSGWQASFDALDRTFVRTYDAEAFATCMVAAEVDRNWRPDQVRAACPRPVATWVLAHVRA